MSAEISSGTELKSRQPARLAEAASAFILRLSLFACDQPWRGILDGSRLFGLWLLLRQNFPRLEAISKICESLSFLCVCLLFLVLPAPQFADDKGLLAILVVFAYALRLIAALCKKEETYNASAIDALVLAFAFMNLLAAFASHYFLASLKGLAKMAVYFISYFLFASSLQKLPRQRGIAVMAAVLLPAFLVSLYGIYQYKIGVAPLATWEDPTVDSKTTRVYATLKNPNLLAGYLVPLVPLAFSTALAAFSATGKLRLLSLPLAAVAASICLAAVFTGSRGGYMGLAAGFCGLGVVLFASLWQARTKLRPLLIACVVLLPLVLAFSLHQFPSYEHRILSIFAGREHSSNSYRMNVYLASVKMFLDSWWLGVGPGNSTFKLAYGLYMKSGFDALGTYCVPLEVAVETGIAGLLVFLGLLTASLARAHVTFWSMGNTSLRWLIAGVATALGAMMVHSLVDTVYYRPQVQFVFWLLIAFCTLNLAKDKEPAPAGQDNEKQKAELKQTAEAEQSLETGN